jgi:hypothetical protein
MDHASGTLPKGYRSHASMHELNIPLFVYNAQGAPPEPYFNHNVDLARWLYQS